MDDVDNLTIDSINALNINTAGSSPSNLRSSPNFLAHKSGGKKSPRPHHISNNSLASTTSTTSSSSSTGSETSVWNIDGELVEHPDLHFK